MAMPRKPSRVPKCSMRWYRTPPGKWRAACRLRAIARHVLGLYHGQSGGRRFRQILSDSARLAGEGPELFLEALAAVEPAASLAEVT